MAGVVLVGGDVAGKRSAAHAAYRHHEAVVVGWSLQPGVVDPLRPGLRRAARPALRSTRVSRMRLHAHVVGGSSQNVGPAPEP